MYGANVCFDGFSRFPNKLEGREQIGRQPEGFPSFSRAHASSHGMQKKIVDFVGGQLLETIVTFF